MKNLKRLMAVLCAVALVFGTVTLPTFAAEAELPYAILDENFGPQYENFVEGHANDPGMPYWNIQDGYFTTFTNQSSSYVDGTFFGGFTFNEPMTIGTYKVQFDYISRGEPCTKSGDVSYGAVPAISLANKENLMSAYNNWFQQFKLMDSESGPITIGRYYDGGSHHAGTALNYAAALESGSTDYSLKDKTNWYHYEMTINKTATGGTYSVKITKANDSTNYAYLENQAFTNSMDWDGLMIGGRLNLNMDNILVEKTGESLAVLLSADFDVPALTSYSDSTAATLSMLTYGGSTYQPAVKRTGGFAYVNVKENGGYGAWQFSEAMGDGTYKVSFDFDPFLIGTTDVWMALDDSSCGASNRLGLLYADQANKTVKMSSDKAFVGSLPTLTDSDTTGAFWFHYNMILAKDGNKAVYSVVLTGLGTGNTDKVVIYPETQVTGANWDRLMIGSNTNNKLLLDNVRVEKLSSTIQSDTGIFAEDFSSLSAPESIKIYGDGTTVTVENHATYGNICRISPTADGSVAWKLDEPMDKGTYRVSFSYWYGSGSDNQSSWHIGLGNMADAATDLKGQFGLFTTKKVQVGENNYRRTAYYGSTFEGDDWTDNNTVIFYEMVLKKTASGTKYFITIKNADKTSEAICSGVSSNTDVWDAILLGCGDASATTVVRDISIERISDDIDIEFVNESGETLTEAVIGEKVSARVTGDGEKGDRVCVIVAEYDDNGVLVDVICEDAAVCDKLTLMGYEYDAVAGAITTDSDTAEIKAFVWNSLTGLVPLLDEAVSIEPAAAL